MTKDYSRLKILTVGTPLDLHAITPEDGVIVYVYSFQEYWVGVLGKWHYLANYNYMPNNIGKIYDTLTNCKNCGAPLRAHVCEYCGTRY